MPGDEEKKVRLWKNLSCRLNNRGFYLIYVPVPPKECTGHVYFLGTGIIRPGNDSHTVFML